MFPVRRWYRPSQLHGGFLKNGFHPAAQTDVKKVLLPGSVCGVHPDALAIGCPVKTSNREPAIQGKNALPASRQGPQANCRLGCDAVLLGARESKSRAVRRKTPVWQNPVRMRDHSKLRLFSCRWITRVEHQPIVSNPAEHADLGWRTRALQIANPGLGKNLLRRATGNRNAHDLRGLRGILGIEQVQDAGTLGV